MAAAAAAAGAAEAAVAEKGGAGQDVEAEAAAAAAVGEISGDKPSPDLSLKNKNKIISDFLQKKIFTLYTSTLSTFHKELKIEEKFFFSEKKKLPGLAIISNCPSGE